ncbi:MAG: hypothetical protein KJ698_02555 [Actinobacteria bacterium]|nr:hypothetical protein [Actinomycetota bacterium]MBU1494167.1 hypothetical protein [Actinomycetota bacterium]
MDAQSDLRLGEVRRAGHLSRDAVSRIIWSLVIGLYVVQAVIAIVNLTPIVDHLTLGQILDVNREGTAFVWLTSMMLWTIALLAVYAAASMRSIGSTRGAWLGWLVIGAGFAVLSVDETAQLHERVGDKVSEFITIPGLPDLYAWVLVVAPIALIGAFWMLKWLGSTVGLGSTTTRLAIAAVGLWVLVPVLEAFDPTLGAPRLLIVAEETCETVGITLFLTGVLVFLRDRGWLRLPSGLGGT